MSDNLNLTLQRIQEIVRKTSPNDERRGVPATSSSRVSNYEKLGRTTQRSRLSQGIWTGRSAKIDSTGQSFEALIDHYSEQYGVDPSLVKAVVKAESNFNPEAVSSAGAKGLMQLMDGTARSLGVTDSFDPSQNVAGGVKYLRNMISKFGSVALALAAYNAGPGAVEQYGGVPPYSETRAYVERVMDYQSQYRDLEA